jgi:hypothetical protein
MGVALYAKSFAKNDKTVLNELKSLSFYDINMEEIGNYISDETVIHDLEIIENLLSGSFNYIDNGVEFISKPEFSFYTLAIDNMDGFGYFEDERYNYAIAHDPKNILPTIEKLIKVANSWDFDNHGRLDIEENKKSLLILKDFLNGSVQKNNLVTFTWG